MRWLFLAVMLVAVMAACETTTETPGVQEFVAEPTTAAIEPTDEPSSEEDQFRTEAAEYCPEEFMGPCTEQYISTAAGSLPAALCVNDENQWFFETPNGDVGDACTDAGTEIVTIVGGE